MKTAIATLILTFGFAQTAFAASGAAVLVCKEITQNENAPKRTMVLRELSDAAIVEGATYAFDLNVSWPSTEKPVFAGTVAASLKDVMLSFASPDGSVQGIVFKDELDQTGLRLNGEDIGFDCN